MNSKHDDLPTRDLSAFAIPRSGSHDDTDRSGVDAPDIQMDVVWARLNASMGQQEPDDMARVGRFVIVDTIGRGAMGVVYRAYDPQLDRRVALKFVEHGGGTTADSRSTAEIEREARAAADLAHPNIVTVYDVGMHGDRMFLAMELVEGSSLRHWLQRPGQTWRAVTTMFAAAARGLAAAHSHGIVHRDFKPDNVLVGADDRPRVADFGLARPIEGWTAREIAREGASDDRALTDSNGSTPSTVATVCGTPAYMSPEQFEGGQVGPAADQFAFCVSLYEGLWGQRPFAGKGVQALAAAVLDERPRPPPSGHRVPRRLYEAVLRGLSRDPEARFDSMETLADTLDDILAARGRRRVRGGMAAVGIIAVAAGVGMSSLAAERPCESAQTLLGATWNDTRRADIVAVHPGAAALTQHLDDYAQQWIDRRDATCERTRVLGQQSELAMQLQVACLERAQVRLEGVVSTLAEPVGPNATATALVVDDIVLPLSSCDDVEALERAPDRLTSRSAFDSEAQRALFLELDETLGRVRVRHRLGHDVNPQLTDVIARAREHGLAHAQAEAELVRGRIAHERGDLPVAEDAYAQAVQLGLATRWDRLAELAVAERVQLLLDTGRVARASELLGVLTGIASREHRPGQDREPQWLVTSLQGSVALARGDAQTAETMLRKAQEQARAEGESSTSEVGLELANNLANAYQARSKYAEAAAEYERIVAALEARGEADSYTAAAAHANLAMAATNLRDYPRAAPHYARALELVRAITDQPHPIAQSVLGNWGWMEREQGQYAEALQHQHQALTMARSLFGPEHPTLGYALDELGELALAQQQWNTAAERFGRALSLREQGLGSTHPGLATSLIGLGEIALARGRNTEAIPLLERASTLLGDPPSDAITAARARLGLARALAPTRPERARQAAAAARALVDPTHPLSGPIASLLERLPGPETSAAGGTPPP